MLNLSYSKASVQVKRVTVLNAFIECDHRNDELL